MEQNPLTDGVHAGYPRMLGLSALGGASPEWVEGYKQGYLCGATIGDYGDGRAVGGRRFLMTYRIYWFPPPYSPERDERRDEHQGFLTGWKHGALKSKGHGRLSPSPMKDRWTEMQVRAACEQKFFMLAAGIRRTGGGANFPEGLNPAERQKVHSAIRQAEEHELRQYYPVIDEGEPEHARWRVKFRLGELLQITNFHFPYLYRRSPRPRYYQ